MPHHVTDSEFHMWRTLFALAFMDDVVSAEEKQLLKAYQSDALFNADQLETLRGDFMSPKDPVQMYAKITEQKDKLRFCALARTLIWCDGDPDRQEAEILRRVGCLKSADDFDILRQSRHHPHLHAYYDRYVEAGMLGLIQPESSFVHDA